MRLILEVWRYVNLVLPLQFIVNYIDTYSIRTSQYAFKYISQQTFVQERAAIITVVSLHMRRCCGPAF